MIGPFLMVPDLDDMSITVIWIAQFLTRNLLMARPHIKVKLKYKIKFLISYQIDPDLMILIYDAVSQLE